MRANKEKRSKTRLRLNKLSARALRLLNKKKMSNAQWNALADWINCYESIWFQHWDVIDEMVLDDRIDEHITPRVARKLRNLHAEKDGMYMMERTNEAF